MALVKFTGEMHCVAFFVSRKVQTKTDSPIDIVGEWVYDANEPEKEECRA